MRLTLVIIYALVAFSCSDSNTNLCENENHFLLNHTNDILMFTIKSRYRTFEDQWQISNKPERLDRYSRLIKSLRDFDKSVKGNQDIHDLIKIEILFLDSVSFLSQVDSSTYTSTEFKNFLDQMRFPIKTKFESCICDTICQENEKLKARLIVQHLSDYM